MNIADVDAGDPVAHVRQDGAWIGSIEISISKAWTSKAFDISQGRRRGGCQRGSGEQDQTVAEAGAAAG